MKRETSHKRHGFISMLWMPLTLYLVMLVTSFVVLTWHDTRNVWEAMDETLDFAVARLEQYSNAMSNDRAMSEIRLLDKTAELAARIAETGMITNEQLDRYAYAQRLTGIVILDADMNAVVQTTIDGDTAAALHAILPPGNIFSFDKSGIGTSLHRNPRSVSTTQSIRFSLNSL